MRFDRQGFSEDRKYCVQNTCSTAAPHPWYVTYDEDGDDAGYGEEIGYAPTKAGAVAVAEHHEACRMLEFSLMLALTAPSDELAAECAARAEQIVADHQLSVEEVDEAKCAAWYAADCPPNRNEEPAGAGADIINPGPRDRYTQRERDDLHDAGRYIGG